MEEVYEWCNLMDHQKIFYTNLFVIDDFVSIETKEKNQSHAEVSKKIIADMKNYISDLWTKRDYDNNWQTKFGCFSYDSNCFFCILHQCCSQKVNISL